MPTGYDEAEEGGDGEGIRNGAAEEELRCLDEEIEAAERRNVKHERHHRERDCEWQLQHRDFSFLFYFFFFFS